MIQVAVHYDDKSIWAHLPELPAVDDAVAFDGARFRVVGRGWDLAPSTEHNGRLTVVVGHLHLERV
jgi:hypothetical protein